MRFGSSVLGCLLMAASACAVESGAPSLAGTAADAGDGPSGSGGSGGSGGPGGSAGSGGQTSDAALDAADEADALMEDASDEPKPDVDFSYDATAPDADACAEVVLAAQQTPVAMYVMLDRSGSMTFANKWATAVDGITQFVSNSAAEGLKVALQYFPLDEGECGGGGYATPAVDMGLLPGHAPLIVSSLQAQIASGATTPMEGALRGLVQFQRDYATSAAGAGDKVIGLLVTDGMPDGPCNNDVQALSTIAAEGFQGAPSTPIYVMGMSGADFTVLSQIASAGGTTGAYSVTTGGASAFLATLEEIRSQAVGCSFAMPQTDAGFLDPDKVELRYSSGSSSAQTLPRQAGLGSCGLGWYFDNNAAPTAILLCPSTCAIVHQDPDARIDISLGCLGG